MQNYSYAVHVDNLKYWLLILIGVVILILMVTSIIYFWRVDINWLIKLLDIVLLHVIKLLIIFLLIQGCYDKLKDYLEQNGILIGTCAVVIAVFMVSMAK